MQKSNEIERKFIVKEIPAAFLNQTPVLYNRYYIYSGEGIELRVQKKGEKYELERKEKKNDLSRETVRIQISKGEFEALIVNIDQSIERESYLIIDNSRAADSNPSNTNPSNTIKKYLGTYKGLIRAEFEFSSEEEAQNFSPPSWVGAEITNTELGKDSKLIKLDRERFEEVLNRYIID